MSWTMKVVSLSIILSMILEHTISLRVWSKIIFMLDNTILVIKLVSMKTLRWCISTVNSITFQLGPSQKNFISFYILPLIKVRKPAVRRSFFYKTWKYIFDYSRCALCSWKKFWKVIGKIFSGWDEITTDYGEIIFFRSASCWLPFERGRYFALYTKSLALVEFTHGRYFALYINVLAPVEFILTCENAGHGRSRTVLLDLNVLRNPKLEFI